MDLRESVSLFLKGLFMGIGNVIPGVSGGTIAFITGIYQRLIQAVKGFSPKLVKDLFLAVIRPGQKSRLILKDDLRRLDLIFLSVLGFGVAVAILIGAKVIRFLLNYYFAYTIVFFIGLILASCKEIYSGIREHSLKNIFFAFAGFLVGLLLLIAVPRQADLTYPYVFLGGFIAVSAMFLPGISGAFILLIMGLYGFILDTLSAPQENAGFLAVFISGAALGTFVISRMISFLFERYPCKTLYFLLGLVLGALSIPVKRIVNSGIKIDLLSIFLMIVLFSAGVTSVIGVTRVQERRSHG
jgi:putative membrane protein